MTTVPIPPPIPDGSVIITPSQMYAEIRAMHTSIERLTTKIDPAMSDIRADLLDHETRLRAVERRVWQAVGVASILSAGGAIAATRLLGG